MGEEKKGSTSIWWGVVFVLFVGYSLNRCLGCDGHVDEEDFVGTYITTDKAGQTFVLELKGDNTATLTKKGTDDVFYCSWSYWVLSSEAHVDLVFSDNPPMLVFDGGYSDRMYCPKMVDGWLYHDDDARKAKNPKRRLSIKKK